MILDSGGTHYPHPAVTEPRSLLDSARLTPTIFSIADGLGYRDFSGSLPADGAGNEGRTQLPAGSPSVGLENAESQGPKNKKRDEKRGPLRTRLRRSQHLDLGEPTQVGVARFRPAQKRPMTTLVLANPSHCSALAH